MSASDSADATRRNVLKAASAAFVMAPFGAVGVPAETYGHAQALETAGDQIRGFRRHGFSPKAVSHARRPYQVGAPRRDNGFHNAAGVRLKKLNGRVWDHPVVQAAYGLQNLWSWELKHDLFFLNRARLQADRLIAHRTEARGAWFFPYPYRFLSRRHHLVLKAPWHSAMAQGEALSLFSRLAGTPEVPQRARNRYRRAAHKAFAAMSLGPARRPWVTHLDAHRYLCLEEYPQTSRRRADFVFNGHNYAAIGLWDYHALTGSPRAAQLFDGALTTSMHYAKLLRRPGDYSSYCLRHDIRNGRYHKVVTRQLRWLHVISGSPAFARMADQFARDAAKARRH